MKKVGVLLIILLVLLGVAAGLVKGSSIHHIPRLGVVTSEIGFWPWVHQGDPCLAIKIFYPHPREWKSIEGPDYIIRATLTRRDLPNGGVLLGEPKYLGISVFVFPTSAYPLAPPCETDHSGWVSIYLLDRRVGDRLTLCY